jgi:hypothetical protein
MKIYKVKIDNDPGGWKSGDDASVLVIAENKDDAVNKVKTGWAYNYGDGKYTYSQTPAKENHMESYISKYANVTATEIIFRDYDVHIKNPRQAKLDRIDKNIKRNEK